MKAEELDELFDSGEEISEHLNLTTAKRIGTQPKKVNVDFPEWIVNALDIEAKKIGLTRQSIIKVWIAERLKAEQAHKASKISLFLNIGLCIIHFL